MAAIEASYRKLRPEWNGVIPTEVFIDEASRIVNKSKNSDVTLRVMGGVGIALHCLDERSFAQKLGRLVGGKQEYTDLDFAGRLKQRNRLVDFFTGELGYTKRRTTLSSSVSQRQIYYHPDGYFTVDVMMDKLLIANHPIDFRARLEIDPLTITPADLLLEDEGEDADMINSKYIAELLSEDWGFCYTATTNLKKIASIVESLDDRGQEVHIDPALVSSAEREEIASKIEEGLLRAIEDHPKSLGWRVRSKLGTSKKWYKDVETPQTIGDFGIWRLREISK